MVSRTQIPFYDEDNGVFRTNEPDFKLAVHLWEDVDNPLVSFRHAENDLHRRRQDRQRVRIPPPATPAKR